MFSETHRNSCKSRSKGSRDTALAGEEDARVTEGLALVRVIAWQMYLALPPRKSVELSDLVQAGNVGLVNASRSFQSGMSVPFPTYARHRIRGEILDSLRKLDGASRSLRQWQRRINRKADDLNATLNRPPTEAEISVGLGIPVCRLRLKTLALRSASESESSSDPEAVPLDRVVDHGWRPDALHQREQLRRVVSAAISKLPSRSRTVIGMYYIDGCTMRDIGGALAVNESRVSQIHKSALQAMAKRLRSGGICSSSDL